MKKIIYLSLALILGFTLSACKDVDSTNPVITGVSDVEVMVGDTFDNMAGVAATDDVDGTITSYIVVTGTVDLTTADDYTLTYTVSDAAGNETVETRTVTVKDEAVAVDETDPVFAGLTAVELTVGDTFDNMAGVTVTDDVDGAITSGIVVNGTVNLATAGVYTLTYTVSDAAGNETVETRTVTVSEAVATEWTGYGYDVAVTGDTETVTYAGVNGAAWWNSNVQRPLESFDAANDAAKFVFKGTAGHSYVFKFEGTGDAVESEQIAATGDEQEFILPLTGVTEADRTGFNKIVLFITTGDAEGTIEIISWEVYTLAGTADEIAPTISGADDTIVRLNGTFDTAAGVTATDETDGDLTANMTIDGTVDMTVAGDYTVTYTVSDAAGNEKVVTRTVTVNDTDWVGYGMAVTKTGDNETITYESNDGAWWANNAQLAVSNFDGTKLGIVFTFTGTEGHSYVFKIEGGGKSTQASVEATGVEQTYTLSLLSLSEAERNNLDLIVLFNETASLAGSIEVVGWEYEVPATTTWLGEGSFTIAIDGDNEVFTYPVNTGDWWSSNAQLLLTDLDGSKDAILFTFTGTAGNVYLFKAEGPSNGYSATTEVVASGVEQTISVDMSGLSVSQRNGLAKLVVFEKTGVAGTLTMSGWELAMAADLADMNPPTISGLDAKLFNMGDAFDQSEGVTATDNVDGDLTSSIVITGTVDMAVAGEYTLTYTVTDAAGNVAAYPRVITVSATSWLGYGFETSLDGDNEVISYPVNNGNWWDLTGQLKVSGFDGTKDQVVFTFTGTEGHEYLFKAEGSKNTQLEVVATGELQSFVLPLDTLTQEQREAIELFVFFNKTASVEGSITIAPWTYEVPAAPDPTMWTGYPFAVVADGDNETISYVAARGQWDNAQYPVTGFDGTKDAIVFTFTGTAGHEYMFKVEGNGNKEEKVIATGAEQTFVLDISGLSETQRNGINKIVVFVMKQGVEGSITIAPWTTAMIADLADTNGPTLSGANDLLLNMGDTFDSAAGVTATDNVDGDLTSSIVITGTVDTAVAGEYTVTYTVTDAAGNITAYPRTIVISPTSWLGFGGFEVAVSGDNEVITYGDVRAEWDANTQLMIDGLDSTKDQVVFTFIGTEGHEYLFKVEGSGAKETTVVATGVEQNLVLPLTGLSAANKEGMNKFVVFVRTQGVAGSLEMIGWGYEEVAQVEWVTEGAMVATLSGDDVLFTYPVNSGNFWDNNGQYFISSFDGTKDLVTFTFTGTAGTTYLFKAEGPNNSYSATEAILADGNEQTVTIDMSSLSEAQRTGLAKWVVFVNDTPGAAGTLTISSWETGQNSPAEVKVDASGLLFQANVSNNGHYGIEKPASVNPAGWDTGKYTVEVYSGDTMVKTFDLDNDGTVVFIHYPHGGEFDGLDAGEYDIHVIMKGNGTTHQDSDPKVFTITFAG